MDWNKDKTYLASKGNVLAKGGGGDAAGGGGDAAGGGGDMDKSRVCSTG